MRSNFRENETTIDHFVPQLFHGEHGEQVSPFGESGLTNRRMGTSGDLWALRATGEEFPIDVAISQVESARKKLFTVIIRDVTERRRAEEAVRESEERFRLVANTAPVLIWTSGPDKRFNYFNQPWLEFTGRPIEEQLGNGWVEGVHPEDLDLCVETYAEAFDRREPFEIRYLLLIRLTFESRRSWNGARGTGAGDRANALSSAPARFAR